jgi:hypothetical protein
MDAGAVFELWIQRILCENAGLEPDIPRYTFENSCLGWGFFLMGLLFEPGR